MTQDLRICSQGFWSDFNTDLQCYVNLFLNLLSYC